MPRNKFKILVEAQPEETPRLPLVHNTDCFALDSVLESGSIDPQPCNVFKGENLTYLFYGKPAFRPNLNEEPSGLYHYYPVCLIFNESIHFQVKRVFPFDSGAYNLELYSKFLHKNMQLEDFGLVADLSSPGKVVSTFFGNNEKYLRGSSSCKSDGLDPSEFEAHSYLALITSRDSNVLDSRLSAIEVQTADVIDLKKCVSAIILPSIFSEGECGKKIGKLFIEQIAYSTFDRHRPSEYMSQITDYCLHYYAKKKLLTYGNSQCQS